MRTIAKLFGRSPFVPIQTHMDKVAEVVERHADLVAGQRQRQTGDPAARDQDGHINDRCLTSPPAARIILLFIFPER